MTNSATTITAPATGMRPIIGYGLAVTASVLFSAKAVIIKTIYVHGIDAETLLALRMILSLPVYLVVGLWMVRRAEVRATLRAGPLLRAFLVGILGYWFASYTDFLGLTLISATFERLILFTYPLFVVLLGALFFGGRVRAAHLAAFVVAYGGLALIFVQHPAEAGGGLLVGAGWVLAAAISFALYQLLAKPVIGTLGPELFTSVAMTGAATASIGYFFVGHGVGDLAVSAEVFHGALLLAFAATVVPTYVMSAALSRISAAANGAISMVSPVATIVLASVFLGEHLGSIEWIGTALVISGIAFFVLGDRRK